MNNTTLEKIYRLFDDINFKECYNCNTGCCHQPWFLKEEQVVLMNMLRKKYGDDTGFAKFFESSDVCRYFVDNKCQIYNERPLDCRIFPLDLIEEDDEYWWVILKNCSKYDKISEKLIPLIPKIETLLDLNLVRQYKKQLAITKETYAPHKSKQYIKIKKISI